MHKEETVNLLNVLAGPGKNNQAVKLLFFPAGFSDLSGRLFRLPFGASRKVVWNVFCSFFFGITYLAVGVVAVQVRLRWQRRKHPHTGRALSEGHRGRNGVSVLQLLVVLLLVVVTTTMVVVVMIVTATVVVVLVIVGRLRRRFHVGRRHRTHGRLFALSQFAADNTHRH